MLINYALSSSLMFCLSQVCPPSQSVAEARRRYATACLWCFWKDCWQTIDGAVFVLVNDVCDSRRVRRGSRLLVIIPQPRSVSYSGRTRRDGGRAGLPRGEPPPWRIRLTKSTRMLLAIVNLQIDRVHRLREAARLPLKLNNLGTENVQCDESFITTTHQIYGIIIMSVMRVWTKHFSIKHCEK